MSQSSFDDFLRSDGIARLQREFGKLVDSDWLRQASETVSSIGLWPPADIRETDDAMVIELDIPGVDSDAVEISVLDGRLRVSGERRVDSDAGDGNEDTGTRYRLRERRRGRFTRDFPLPANADEAGIEARGRQGVYTVTIPFHQGRGARRVPVQTG